MFLRALAGRNAFDRLFDQGRRLRLGWLTLICLPNGLSGTRFGCAIRKGVCKTAVRRNRVKRWIREGFRKHRSICPPGWDMVLLVQKVPDDLNFETTEKQICNLLKSKELKQ
ncbi:MAG: ribonuclease P protein component [Candidatus Omnitrophica bacterium CG11_big_fil_rev_8_21_14_0_20_64_10]|nr:MAG: ribonuclease P protein component [Candidatus Omnitrophica bacterium CG11_big_fil_rev_8_21_14_0_20_64_10]